MPGMQLFCTKFKSKIVMHYDDVNMANCRDMFFSRKESIPW